MTQPRNLKRILLAEDDADIRTIAVLALESFGGFEVVSCESGTEVAAVAREFQPDLILLDVMMPGTDGPSALKELQVDAGLKTIPVIFLTARIMKAEVEGLKALGAIEVIAKPFDPETLVEQVRQAWARWID